MISAQNPPWYRWSAVCAAAELTARGVTRQALLLDVEEALVDEFVDAEGAELAAEAGALGAAERQVRALACRGVYVGHADLQLLGDVDRPLLVRRPDRAAKAEVHHVGQLDRLVVGADLVDDGDRAEQLLAVGPHLRGHAGEHGRGEVRALAVVERAADVQRRALRYRVLHLGEEILRCPTRDHRTVGERGVVARLAR